MRYAFGLLMILASFGCGTKDGSSGTTATSAPPPATIVKNWKTHTAHLYLFKARFPLGDPTHSPVFPGKELKAVQEATDFSAPVYTKETGNEQKYLFGICSA